MKGLERERSSLPAGSIRLNAPVAEVAPDRAVLESGEVLHAGRAEGPGAQARFKQEARVVATLSHPNVLALYDFGEEEGLFYAVTELLAGDTLQAHLREGAMPVRKALDCASQIVAGLAAAHDKGIVHRDLKPANIKRTPDGKIKVLDLGLAKALLSAAGIEVTSRTLAVGEATAAEIDEGSFEALLALPDDAPMRATDDETVRAMIDAGATSIVECGPGKVLTGLVRRIDKETPTGFIDTPDSLQKALQL